MADVFSTQAQLDTPNWRMTAEDKLTVMEVEHIQATDYRWTEHLTSNLGYARFIELRTKSALIEENLQVVRKWFGCAHTAWQT